ncbi:MAG: hypothetical protein KJ957_02740 [Candidatus Omnitrophica bacterium]|nr:hypothetical protein [Candidatus Omnitrophota bacterium]
MNIKFWKGPSHAHRVVMFGFVIAGLVGLLFGIYVRDIGIVGPSLGIIVIGLVFGGLQSIVWKQWEERQKKQGKTPRIFPSLEQFFKKFKRK